MRFCLTLWFSCCLLYSANIRAYAEECLIVASDPNAAKALSLFTPGVQQMFQKADICVNYITLPIDQIKVQIADGAIDGEYLRVREYVEQMKEHVIAIPTPVVEGKGILVTMRVSGFAPKSISDTGNKVIGYVKGLKWQETLLKKIKNPRRSAKYETLAKQLKKGLIDGFLVDELTIHRLFKARILSPKMIYKSPPVKDISAYIVLHKKNSNYIPMLDMALKEVKKEGGFDIKK